MQMRIPHIFLILIMILQFSISSNAQENPWKLKTNKKGITIYTRNVSNTNLKEVKITTLVKSNLASIVNILDEVELYPEWMDACTSGKKLKTISATEGLYMTTLDFPRPFSDRNIVSKTTTHQDKITKTISIKSVAVEEKEFQNPKMVMVKHMNSSWVLIPKGKEMVQIESYLFCDPGGNIPAWAVNSLLDKGPYKTMQNLTQRLTQVKYKNKSLPNILEL